MPGCKPGDIARVNASSPRNVGAMVAVLTRCRPPAPTYDFRTRELVLSNPGPWWWCTTLSTMRSEVSDRVFPGGTEVKMADLALNPENPPAADDQVTDELELPREWFQPSEVA